MRKSKKMWLKCTVHPEPQGNDFQFEVSPGFDGGTLFQLIFALVMNLAKMAGTSTTQVLNDLKTTDMQYRKAVSDASGGSQNGRTAE